jgi:hypothetical protein
MRLLPPVSLLLASAISAPAFAQASTANASAAGAASSDVASHLAASGVQTALAASVVPASVAGTVSTVGGASALGTGIASVQGAQSSANAASGSPLKVTDRVVVAPDPAPHVPYNTEKPHA